MPDERGAAKRPHVATPQPGNRLPPGLQARLQGNPPAMRRNFNKHVKAEDGTFVLDRVDCRLCGTALMTWKVHPAFEHRTRKVPGTNTVIQEVRMVFNRTAAYDEAAIETEQVVGQDAEGEPIVVLGKHITAVCKECKPRVTDDQADDLYVTDLEQMAINDAAARQPIDRTRKVLTLMAGFRGRRILREE